MIARLKRKGQLLPVMALLIAVTMWGSTFPIQKDVLTRMDVYDFLGVRFMIAGVVSAVIFFPQLRRASKRLWKRGFILSLLFAAGQVVQSFGLTLTPASITGFLTGLYVVLIPICTLVLFHEHQPRRIWFAVALATLGLAVMSLKGFSMGFGETLVLISAVIYTFHVVFIESFVEGEDPLALTASQMIFVGVWCFIAALPGGVHLPSSEYAVRDWAVILYMAIGTGIGSLVLQVWAQSRISATQAAVVMTGEPVSGAFFAVIMINEQITGRVAVGGLLIVGAMILSQIDFSAYLPRAFSRWRHHESFDVQQHEVSHSESTPNAALLSSAPLNTMKVPVPAPSSTAGECECAVLQ